MYYNAQKLFLVLLLFFSISSAFAQMPLDGFYPKKNAFTIAPSYSYKSYNKFFRGSILSEGNPAGLGEISSDIFSFYGRYAISDWLSTAITLPYITIKSGSEALDPVQNTNSVAGIQDLGIYLKARALEKQFNDGSAYNLGVALGVTFPVGDYEGAGVLSIGNQATTISGAAIAQYTLPFKVFGEAQLGYSSRFSSDFEIPNAMVYRAKIGYFNDFLYLHAQIDMQDSLSGTDIGTPEFAAAGGPNSLPETQVDYTNLTFEFYIPIYKTSKNNLGLSATYSKTIDGRNYDKGDGFSFGVVYDQF